MKRPICHLRARNHVLTLGRRTQVMGIINCTPDSFSGDGLLRCRRSPTRCLAYARQLIADGADILDVGGESTRPDAPAVSEKEEIRRVIPVIQLLHQKTGALISVDTSKTEVARQALKAGASIINDIYGTQLCRDLLTLVRDTKAAIVLMHMRGTPQTMQSYAKYKDVVGEVIHELKISVEKCLQVGIKKDRIVIDPGIGFAKTMAHNLILIKHLDRLGVLGCPVLLGASRKSFIGQILSVPPDERLMGTAATVAAGIWRGGHIVRVHDVAQIKQTVAMTDAILNAA